MPEDRDSTAEERLSVTVAFDTLGAEKTYESLAHSKAGCVVWVWQEGSFHYEVTKIFRLLMAAGSL
jgi:hypothetical protein